MELTKDQLHTLRHMRGKTFFVGPRDYQAEIDRLKAENARLKQENSKWFKKGRESVLRDNRSGCCCKFDEDESELLEPCLLHKEWADAKLAEALKALRDLLYIATANTPTSIDARAILAKFYDKLKYQTNGG